MDAESAANSITPLEPSEERTLRQRLEDAGPMIVVGVGCFGLALYLRATGSSGSVPALPIWTLFLALGVIASLGAGASFVLGNSDAVPPPREPKASRIPPAAAPEFPLRSRRVLPSPLGDPGDAALPPIRWTSESQSMTASSRRQRAEPPASDFELGATEEPPEGPTKAVEVIDEIDRMLDDLRPASLRRRPAA